MKFEELQEITSGDLLTNKYPSEIGEIHFDSRTITSTLPESSDVFVAISGDFHDGNDFVQDAFKKGVRQFIIERTPPDQKIIVNSNILLVQNTLTALQQMAAFHRNQTGIPIIGITGSNGKTIIKEWLSTLLRSKYNTVKNPGSYNSQLGVALSILKLKPSHEIGIFEAGISTTGEMSRLVSMMQPTIGIFTNIGPAHGEGFQNLQEKIKEKVKLFEGTETIIYNDTNSEVVSMIETLPGADQKKLIKWGEKSSTKVIFHDNEVSITSKGSRSNFAISFLDPASQENLAHCLVLLLHLGFSPDEIQSGIPLLRNIPMRLSVKKGINNSILVDDSYNNDAEGLSSALKFIGYQKAELPLILIISDIMQSKKEQYELYQEIAGMITKHRVSEVYGVGNQIGILQEMVSIPVHIYPETDLLLKDLTSFPINPSRVIIKGARAYKMERVVEMLSERMHATRLELNMTNLVHNLNVYRSILEKKTRIMVMVKALAYGTHSLEVARLLEYHGVAYLGVAYADEGINLRENGILLPIMVMNPTISAFPKMIEHDLEPEIYSFRILEAYIAIAGTNSVPGIHLKIDSGMHRLGFNPKDAERIILLIKNSKLKLASIFSHLAAADDDHQDSFTQTQIEIFKSLAQKIESTLDQKVTKHILNSSGIVNHPDAQMDMVRLGIGIHGYDPTGKVAKQLMPVGRLISSVSQIIPIEENDTVGYNRSGVVQKPTQIGTISIGYADGFKRSLGNGAFEIWANNHRLKTIGDVCMDMVMVDTTDAVLNEGDEVEIFGTHIPLSEIAEKANTIPYEILTSISSRVKRVFLYE